MVMSRSTATLLLATCLIVLAALLGLAGYRFYQRLYVQRPVAVMTSVSMPPDIDVIANLRSTPTGVVVDVKITNNTSDPFREVRLTKLEFDRFAVPGLPKRIVGVKAHASTTVTYPLPGIKTTSPSYEDISYEYDMKYGSGSGSYGMGMKPAAPAIKKPISGKKGITL